MYSVLIYLMQSIVFSTEVIHRQDSQINAKGVKGQPSFHQARFNTG